MSAKLPTIKPSISQLSYSEALSIHEAIRASRVTTKTHFKKKRESKRKKATFQDKLAQLSLEEIEALEKMLKEKRNDT